VVRFAPDITNASPQGLGNWSAEDIGAYLKTGHNLFAAATGPMAEVVERSSSNMTDADLHAVTVYLKDQPGSDAPAPQPIAGSDPAMARGKVIYADECSACHAPQGSGQPNLFPRLAGSPAVQSHDITSLARVVLAGTRSVATPRALTAPAMPGFAWLLNDRDVADVLTFIRNSWGNAASALSADQIQKVRKALTERTG
jgi:mono/diheme cytochrome c family protein